MNIDNILSNITNINFSERSVLALCATAAAMVLLVFIYVTWQWGNDWRLAHEAIRIKSPVTTTDATTVMITQIPDTHLFGHPITKTGDMPITNLQLHVSGIVGTEDPSGSKVYLSISGQPSKIYQIGDSLPDGVKIYEINPTTVILENNGRLEKLPLFRAALKFKPKSTGEHLQ